MYHYFELVLAFVEIAKNGFMERFQDTQKTTTDWICHAAVCKAGIYPVNLKVVQAEIPTKRD